MSRLLESKRQDRMKEINLKVSSEGIKRRKGNRSEGRTQEGF